MTMIYILLLTTHVFLKTKQIISTRSVMFCANTFFIFNLLQDSKQKQNQSLPVIMPGDRIAKFIAMPCPCEPLRADKIIVQVEKPPKPPQIAVPLY